MDPIQSLLTSPRGRRAARLAGLQPPPTLRRYQPGQDLLTGPALLGQAPGGRLAAVAESVLKGAGAEVVTAPVPAGRIWGALVFDATGISSPDGLVALHEFFRAPLRGLAPSGRVLVLGTPPELAADADARIAQRALEGFTRSLAKELRAGATAHLVLVAPGAEDRIAATVLFLASARSAFVDGQVIRVGNAVDNKDVAGKPSAADPERPLAGCGVVVTGAARGIGAAMVATLARDGATVLGVDIAPLADDLVSVMAAAGGHHLVTDITSASAPAKIATAARDRFGSLHGIVHNAGITRDRKLVNLDESSWQRVIAVNLVAPQRITAELVDSGTLGAGGRVVAVSSISGIAGNAGQTNYAASKAGVIGFVDALAPDLAARGITVNAVAPGFIETAMTKRVPLMVREAGRRLSSLRQGGQPVDVAETVGWLLDPGSYGVTGVVLRVCGQGLIGA